MHRLTEPQKRVRALEAAAEPQGIGSSIVFYHADQLEARITEELGAPPDSPEARAKYEEQREALRSSLLEELSEQAGKDYPPAFRSRYSSHNRGAGETVRVYLPIKGSVQLPHTEENHDGD